MTNNLWFEAKNITCFKNGYKVVKDFNIKLEYGQNVMIIGPNGSGKSSIIELINRNIYPIEGDNVVLKIFNKDLINIWELRKKINTVNSEIKNRFDPNIKVIDLIISGLYGKYCEVRNKTDQDISIAQNLIKKMSIYKLNNKNFLHLSDGEKQIVLIARGLIKKPKILILDEPTNNLDLKSKFYVIDQINELSKLGTNLLCISHDISMITKIYNRVIMLKDRSIIADGNQRSVMNNLNINKLFEINVKLLKSKDNWSIYR